jgi:hypothetical protein
MSFLATFLHFAHDTAQAERGVALSPTLEVVARVNVEDSDLGAPKFIELTHQVAMQAYRDGSVVITNNAVTDPTQAPMTNTSFADLRVVVAFSLAKAGIIYLDRPIKLGVIPRDTLEKLKAFGESLLTDDAQDTTTLEKLKARYDGFSA